MSKSDYNKLALLSTSGLYWLAFAAIVWFWAFGAFNWREIIASLVTLAILILAYPVLVARDPSRGRG